MFGRLLESFLLNITTTLYKEDFNIHATVKPKDLIRQLIELSVPE